MTHVPSPTSTTSAPSSRIRPWRAKLARTRSPVSCPPEDSLGRPACSLIYLHSCGFADPRDRPRWAVPPPLWWTASFRARDRRGASRAGAGCAGRRPPAVLRSAGRPPNGSAPRSGPGRILAGRRRRRGVRSRPPTGGRRSGRLSLGQPVADDEGVGSDPLAGVPGGRLGPLQPPFVALPGGGKRPLRLDDGGAVTRAGPACFKAGQPLDPLHGPPYRARTLAVGVDPGHVIGVGGVAQDQHPLLGLPQGEVA